MFSWHYQIRCSLGSAGCQMKVKTLAKGLTWRPIHSVERGIPLLAEQIQTPVVFSGFRQSKPFQPKSRPRASLLASPSFFDPALLRKSCVWTSILPERAESRRNVVFALLSASSLWQNRVRWVFFFVVFLKGTVVTEIFYEPQTFI